MTTDGEHVAQTSDLPDYFVSGERPLGSCHQGGTFGVVYTTQTPGHPPQDKAAPTQARGAIPRHCD